jgi:hypothetical protein
MLHLSDHSPRPASRRSALIRRSVDLTLPPASFAVVVLLLPLVHSLAHRPVEESSLSLLVTFLHRKVHIHLCLEGLLFPPLVFSMPRLQLTILWGRRVLRGVTPVSHRRPVSRAIPTLGSRLQVVAPLLLRRPLLVSLARQAISLSRLLLLRGVMI